MTGRCIGKSKLHDWHALYSIGLNERIHGQDICFGRYVQ